jgi:hypothetical protein
MHQFGYLRSPNALHDRVVVADASPTHARKQAVLLEQCLMLTARVPHTQIAVIKRRTGELPPHDGDSHYLFHQVGSGLIGRGQSDQIARAENCHIGQIKPVIVSGKKRNVGDTGLIGRGLLDLSNQRIRRDRMRAPAVSCAQDDAFRHLRLNSTVSHQFGERVAGAHHAYRS